MASHRLIQYLGKKYGLAVSEAIYDRLNVYYFVEGHALNDRPRLAETVVEELRKLLDNPPASEDILAFLNGTEGRENIERALELLQQLGIHGIPKFIIEGQTVVDGAARPDVFVDIFRDIERRGEIASGPVFGKLLGIGDETIEQGSHHRREVAV